MEKPSQLNKKFTLRTSVLALIWSILKLQKMPVKICVEGSTFQNFWCNILVRIFI